MPSTSDISIIVPAYCTSKESLKWLEECLASAVKQGSKVIVVDDGSTVDVKRVAGKYSVDNFTALGKNAGVSHARNVAVAIATTELILPLDCDDRLKVGAVEKLLEHWNGVPVYPDVEKFGEVSVPHFALLDFHCDHVRTHVGFTSVNVLHSKQQWKIIGGWDEGLDFYEDGEYNARLFGNFCGVHCREPLVEYRIHENQRVKQYAPKAADYGNMIIERIRSYDMPCPSCGKRKTQSSSPRGVAASQVPAKGVNATGQRGNDMASVGSNPVNMPIEFEGKVLVQYLGGKGKGKHYYQGRISKQMHRVSYGDFVYVDPRDAKMPTDPGGGTYFVRVVRQEPPPPPAPPPPPPAPVRQPIRTAVKQPVIEKTAEQKSDIPEISQMTYRQVFEMEIASVSQAKKLLAMETTGLNRKKVITYLQSRIDGAW